MRCTLLAFAASCAEKEAAGATKQPSRTPPPARTQLLIRRRLDEIQSSVRVPPQARQVFNAMYGAMYLENVAAVAGSSPEK